MLERFIAASSSSVGSMGSPGSGVRMHGKRNPLLRLALFSIACAIGTAFAFFWLYVGEPWKVLADGEHYLALYRGDLAPEPFGYRVMTPYIAELLPWSPIFSFGLVTVGSLVLTTGAVALYAARDGASLLQILALCFLWGASFAFVYYGTTLVRADGPMFLILALVFLLSRYKVPSTLLLALIALGILAHETVLICIPALWLDKVLSGTMTGGASYRYRQLVLITVGALAVFFASRALIPVLPGNVNYLSTPVAMFEHVLNYSGGPLKHALRIYASYGPALIFSLFFAATRLSTNNAISYLALLATTIAATFFATDTLRIMAIVYLPVLFYAAGYLGYLAQAGYHIRTVLCIVLQGCYSLVVYGHLRSFETSLSLNAGAAALSLVALAVCISVFDRGAMRDRFARLRLAFGSLKIAAARKAFPYRKREG